MILKISTVLLLAMAGSFVNADVISDGTVYHDGPVITASVVPTIKTMETMVTTLTTTSTTIQNAIGVTHASSVESEVGLIPQTTIVATTSIPVIVPNGFDMDGFDMDRHQRDLNYLDQWDAEQKRKAGIVSGECPIDRSCHGDEEIWLSHLPTLGELIDSYFEPDDREFFTWLAYCESSGDPLDIYSSAIHETSKATGWFQHLPKFWEERSVKAGFEGFPIDHPDANVGVAAWLFYEDGGAKHWKACTKRYLRETLDTLKEEFDSGD